MATFLVRPSNSEKEAFKVKLTAASLLGLKLKPGDLCILRREAENDSGSLRLGHAIAWEAPGGMKDNVMQASKSLQDLHGFKLGDKLVVERSEMPLEDAEVVKISSRDGGDALDEEQIAFWRYYARHNVKAAHEFVAHGQLLIFRAGLLSQQFRVVDAGAQSATISRITEQTRFQIVTIPPTDRTTNVVFTSQKLGGVQEEMKAVQKRIDNILRPIPDKPVAPVQGVLIYGAKGVGKSHFIEQLAVSGWESVIWWTPGTKVSKPKQSTLIIVDPLDLPSRDSQSSLRELLQMFKTIRGTACMVMAEAKHPNDVNPSLRSRRAFGLELEIPIPAAKQRKDILFALWANIAIPRYSVIEELAQRTHGYVAEDLEALLDAVVDIAIERGNHPLTKGHTSPSETTDRSSYTITSSDIDEALSKIRPSALQEIFLETPKTRWSDIGGQHEIKKQLQNAVERPLKQAKQMEALNLPPKKGLLMYGPPGCSKTLLVRALAREAGLNFLAVKGAELISMYVGESERAVREVFRKARAASPSIIFFDEIDSIASRGRPGSELNVLTTLLNEMDGFEELRNVFVVAATNKPETIDPALLRPGRFDNVVYIGPPDLEARREIFQTQFERSNYRPRDDCSVGEDVSYWAEKTQGYSGADLVALRVTAGDMSLDEGDQTRQWYGFEHVAKALKVTPKSISRAMLDGFEKWNAARMT